MPYSIEKQDGKFCVLKKGTGENKGCSDTLAEAQAHLKSLYAAEAQYAIVESGLSFHGMDEDYVPKPGLPLQHLETMKMVIESLKQLIDIIINQHFAPADIPADQAPPVESPGHYAYSLEEALEQLTAAAKAQAKEYSWEGPVAFEGVYTGDKRYFHPGSIEWNAESFPVPFRWQKSSVQGHTGAVPIGRVDHLERKEDGTIYGYGVVIPSLNDEAAEYLRLLESGVASGVSVDGDSAVFDVRELADGTTSIEFSNMRIRSLTAVDIPAFSDAQVDLVSEDDDTEELARKKRKKAMKWVYSLTAAAGAPVKPPVELVAFSPDENLYEQYVIIDVCKLHVRNAKNMLNLSDEASVTHATNIFPTIKNFRTDSVSLVPSSSQKDIDEAVVNLAGKKSSVVTIEKLTCGCQVTLNTWSENELPLEPDTPRSVKKVKELLITKLNGDILPNKDNLNSRSKGIAVLSAAASSAILKDEELSKTLIKIIVTPKTSSETSFVLLATEPLEAFETIQNYFRTPLNISNNMAVVVASAIPVKPPIEWFTVPELDGPTPITITPQGEIYGHLATWNQCHIGFPGSCVSPPKNGSYKYFHTGEIETDKGDLVEIGHLTFNTGHAAMRDTAKAAAAHYDHTGTVAADVRVGEDKHGIWVAGALRSHLGDEDVRAFRAAPLSGDWRRIAGRLELVGALAVNVPGFPVPRVRTLVASGETETLITFQEAELIARQDRKEELGARVEELGGQHNQKTHGRSGGGGGGADANSARGDGGEIRAAWFKNNPATKALFGEAQAARQRSPEFKKVVSGGAVVKIKKLRKADLSKFSTDHLKTLQDGLTFNQSHFKKVEKLGWVQLNPMLIGVSRWKTNRIPGQINRVQDEIKNRGESFSSEWLTFGIDFEFATDNGDMSLVEEIAQAAKQIADGQKGPGSLSAGDKIDALGFLNELLSDTENDSEDEIDSELRKEIETAISKATFTSRRDKKAELAQRVGILQVETTEELEVKNIEELADKITKSEGDAGNFPASDYAYVPDPFHSSTWKLRLTATPGGEPDAGIVGAAVAALGKGFRGQTVDLPAEDRPRVIAKVRAAWLKANKDKTEKDLPDVLK